MHVKLLRELLACEFIPTARFATVKKEQCCRHPYTYNCIGLAAEVSLVASLDSEQPCMWVVLRSYGDFFIRWVDIWAAPKALALRSVCQHLSGILSLSFLQVGGYHLQKESRKGEEIRRQWEKGEGRRGWRRKDKMERDSKRRREKTNCKQMRR